MIYACHNGFGGVINKYLSWSFWVPLSHLTFMAYLFHPLVYVLMYRTMRFQYISVHRLDANNTVCCWSGTVVLPGFDSSSYCAANIENAVYKFVGLKRRNRD